MKKVIMKVLLGVAFLFIIVGLNPITSKAYDHPYERKEHQLAQTAWSDTTITVEWPQSKDVDYWKVFYIDEASESDSWIYLDTVYNTCYTLTNLKPGSSLTIGVKAYPIDEGLIGTECEDDMDYIVNSAKTTLSTISNDYNYIWRPGNNVITFKPNYTCEAASYTWKYYNGKDKPYMNSGTGIAYISYERRPIIKVKTKACVRIQDPHDLHKKIACYSNEVEFYHIFQTAPRSCKVAKDKKSFTIKWRKAAYVTGYEVWCSTKPKSGYKKIKTLGKNTTSCTIKKINGKKVNANKPYYYFIKTLKDDQSSEIWFCYSTKKGVKKPAMIFKKKLQ